MNMQSGIKVVAVISLFLLAFEVKATPIYVNPLGENSSDPNLSLQGILDARGNTLINVYSDQLDAGVAAAWTSTGSSSVTVVDAVAGSVAINIFGIYDIADPTKTMQILVGGQGGNTASFISPWVEFGFFLINPNYGYTSYSDPSLNAGQAHVVTYQGRGETLNLGSDPSSPVGSILLGSNGYLLGWEDTDLTTADLDYNDLIVVLDNVQPAPDNFATVGLLGMAMVGLVILQNLQKASVKKTSVIQRKHQRKQ
jgi:Domain of unknown function (DUF4114)